MSTEERLAQLEKKVDSIKELILSCAEKLDPDYGGERSYERFKMDQYKDSKKSLNQFHENLVREHYLRQSNPLTQQSNIFRQVNQKIDYSSLNSKINYGYMSPRLYSM